MATWKWSQTPYSDRHYERMADLALQSGQAKAQTQQQLWNTVGSTIMDLPRSVQQASYYDTLAQRQAQALAKEQEEENQERAYSVGSTFYRGPNGKVNWSAWTYDLDNPPQPGSAEFADPNSYWSSVSPDGGLGKLRAKVGSEARVDRAIEYEEIARGKTMRSEFSAEFADAAMEVQAFDGTPDQQYEFFGNTFGPNSYLMKRAGNLDRFLETTEFTDRLTGFSSTPRATFFGQDPEIVAGEKFGPVKQADSWTFLNDAIQIGMTRSQQNAMEARIDKETTEAILKGIPLDQPFPTFSPIQKAAAGTAIANLMNDLSGSGPEKLLIRSQEDIDALLKTINNGMNGYLDESPGLYDALAEKGLLYWPTDEDVKANASMFEGKEEHTPENLYALNLRNSGIDAAVNDVTSKHHGMLVWAAGDQGLQRALSGSIPFNSTEWGAMSKSYCDIEGECEAWDSYLAFVRRDANIEIGGDGSGTVTPTQRRNAFTNYNQAVTDIDAGLQHDWQVMDVADLTDTSRWSAQLEYMGDDGEWKPGVAEAIWTHPVTQERITVLSPRHETFLYDVADPEMEGRAVMSTSQYKRSVQLEAEKAQASVGAPPPTMTNEVRDIWLERMNSKNEKGETLGYIKEQEDIWPVYPKNENNDDLKRSGTFWTFSDILEKTPEKAERLFADYLTRFGMDILEFRHPGAVDDFTYEYYTPLMESFLGRTSTLPSGDYSPSGHTVDSFYLGSISR